MLFITLSDFTKTWNASTGFGKTPNIKCPKRTPKFIKKYVKADFEERKGTTEE
jgi:hypothetical protein